MDQNANHIKSSFFRKSVKGLMWLLLIVVVLLIIALFCFNAYLSSNKSKILDNLEFLNNGVVSFDEANISVFKNFPSATLSLNNVLLNSKENEGQPIFKVDELNAALTIGEILKNKVAINALDFRGGTINLVKDKNEVINLSRLFTSKSGNSTDTSSDWEILTDEIDLSLSEMNVNLKDESKDIAAESTIGALTATLKKANQDWNIEFQTTNSSFTFDNHIKHTTIAGQINTLQSTIYTNKSNPVIDIQTNDTDIQFTNSKKGTRIIGQLKDFKSQINHTDNKWIAAIDMVTDVEELTFNKDKGSFIPNTTLTGKFTTELADGKMKIPPFDLQIDDATFLFEAVFQPRVYNKISIENKSTNFDKTVALLTKPLQEKIGKYHVEKPFYSKTTIEGDFIKGSTPLVVVYLKLPNNKVKALGQTFDEVKLEGAFRNQLTTNATSSGKKNFEFELKSFDGKYKSFDVSTQNALLTSTKADGLALLLNANVKGDASLISQWFRNDQFIFKKGTFELGAQIDAPFQSFDDLIMASNTTIDLHNFSVWYKPTNVTFPFDKLSVAKKSEEANFSIVNSSFVPNHQVLVDGMLQNLSTLLFHNSDLPTQSQLHIITSKLSWLDFTNLFGQEGIFVNKNKKDPIKETLHGMYDNFQPKITLDIDTIAYYESLQLLNFKTGLHFEDQNTLVLEKTAFDYDIGSIDFSAKLDISQPDQTPFEFELHTTDLNLEKLLPSFDFFNIKLLEDLDNQPDDLKINIKHSGIIDDHTGVLTNTSNGVITIESQGHNGTICTIAYEPNADQTKLVTTVKLEGEPSLFNEFFKTEQFFFSEGRFAVELDFLGDLTAKEHLMTQTIAKFSMTDASIYYKPVDVTFPLKQVDLNLKQDNADFSIFIRSDEMDRQMLFEGDIENLSEIIIGNTGKHINVNVNISSPILEWSNIQGIFIPKDKPQSTPSTEGKKSNIKVSIRELMRTFNPTINLNFDQFIYTKDLGFENMLASLHLQDSTDLVLENTSFNFYGGNIMMDGRVNLDKTDSTPFETSFSTEKVHLDELIKGLDYLNLPSLRSVEKLSGHIDMDFDFHGALAKGGKALIPEETLGHLDFTLSDVELKGLPSLDTIATKFRMQRRFEDLRFAPITNQLTIKGQEIDIPLMEIQSNALNVFMEGKLSYGDNTNIWISLPTSNLRLRDFSTIPDKKGYGPAGKKVFVEVTSDETGANHYKFRTRKRQYYKSRGILKQYRVDRRRWRKERQGL